MFSEGKFIFLRIFYFLNPKTWNECTFNYLFNVVLTKIERFSDITIITGTLNVKVFGVDNKKNDPNIKDRIIVGKRWVKHTLLTLNFELLNIRKSFF